MIEKGDSLTAILIIEVLGRPAEHVKEVLSMLVKKLEQEKDVKVTNSKIYEPKQIEQLYSSFAEVEARFSSFHRLLEICMEYLPSSIEIIEPQELRLKLQDANAILNYLSAKLHKYEAVVKILAAQRVIAEKQLKEHGIIPKTLQTSSPEKEEGKSKGKEKKKKEK